MPFIAEPNPSAARARQVAALAPDNAFATAAYASARQSLGEACWLLGLESGQLRAACFGFLRQGRVNRALEIPSLPTMDEGDDFFAGLLGACHDERITVLDVNSYSSTAVAIPPLPRETQRRERLEWVLDLAPGMGWAGLSSNHRRGIARAQKLGISVRRAGDADARAEHRRLMESSLDRRASRGEHVGLTAADADALTRSIIEAGAGEIFQARLGEQVLSSILVLLADRGAYYQSAGTSADGMKAGASAFLIHSVAEALMQENKEVFNLGDARPDSAGLYRFKSGFGARNVPLAAVRARPFTFRRSPLAAMLHLGRHLLGGEA